MKKRNKISLKKYILASLGALIAILFLVECSSPRIHRITVKPSEFDKSHASQDFPYIKLHMPNGNVYSLSEWEIIESENQITGVGKLLDFNRNEIGNNSYSVAIDNIVLIETNRISTSEPVVALSVMTGITALVTGYCIANPKACFGSCPTFYVYDGEEFVLQAEGFSSSVSPSLEESDIDAIFNVRPKSSDLFVKVKNEALETHVIRSVNILALPRRDGTRIFASPDGKFFESECTIIPASCIGPEGDILPEISSFDRKERFSISDSTDLCSKEIIELTFDSPPEGTNGLVISFRQTLLTTFLFYQTLAYMGKDVGIWLSKLERVNNSFPMNIQHIGSLLGGIEVMIQSSGGDWQLIGEVDELGPISKDVQVISLSISKNTKPIKVRLRMTRGLWRINHIALAQLNKEIEPIRIVPTKVYSRGREDKSAFERLTNSNEALITLPGDEYQIYYKLPQNYNEYELFIESQGYYLEWMRNEWLPDEDPDRITQMLINPKQYLKDLAPQFKKIEASMEESFWRSKYVIP